MADTTDSPNQNEPFTNVASEDYDGRSFTHPEDNADNVQHYVGVDPIYQNYANEGEKPFPFSREELVAAAERGGLEVDDEDDEDEDDSEDGESEQKTEPSVATAKAPEPVKAVPTQRTAPASRAAAKDTSKSDDKK